MPTHSSPSVFVSYARSCSSSVVDALLERLGPGKAFVDTSHVTGFEPFPEQLASAIASAQLFVLVLHDDYFRRPWCVRELAAARSRYDALLVDPAAAPEAVDAALSHIFVIEDSAGVTDLARDRLPPALRSRSHPRGDDIDRVVADIERRLAGAPLTASAGSSHAAALARSADVPVPASRNVARYAAVRLPQSLGGGFYGRARQLERILFELSTRVTADGGIRWLALTSWGGTGKSRIALEFLYRYAPSYFPGGAFWLNGSDPTSRDAQFFGALRALDPARATELADNKATPVEIEAALVASLDRAAGQGPLLWIVDDLAADSPLTSWCPPVNAEMAVLVTSRLRQVSPKAAHLPLHTLDRRSAIALLQHDLQPAYLSSEHAASLAEWVGDYPLALELLNRSLIMGTSPTEWITRARSASSVVTEADRAMKDLRGLVPDQALRGIAETLLASWRSLDDESRVLAAALSHYAMQPLPRVLVEAIEGATTRAVLTVVQRCFVSAVDVDTLGGMHQVVADFLRGQREIEAPVLPTKLRALQRLLTGDGNAASRDLERAARAITGFVRGERSDDPRSWPLLDQIAPHARALFERTPSAQQTVIDVGVALAHLRACQGDYAAARGLLDACFDRETQVRGRASLAVLHNLAHVLDALGDHDRALALQTGAVEEARAGGESSDTYLSARGQYAAILWNRGDVKQARAIEEEIVEVRRRIHGDRHPATLRAQHNLAASLLTAGDAQGALAMVAPLTTLIAQVVGATHPATLSARYLLASTLGAVGRVHEALTVAQDVLDARIRELGEEHPDTGRSRVQVAKYVTHARGHDRAASLTRDALAAHLRAFGADHPEVGVMQRTLAEFEIARGAYRTAIVELERLEAGATDESARRFARSARAAAMLHAGDSLGAMPLLEQHAAETEADLGTAHEETVVARTNLAMGLVRTERVAAAVELLRTTLSAAEPHLPPFSEAMTNLRSNLAHALGFVGGHQEACDILETLIPAVVAQRGSDHSAVAAYKNNLAATYRALGRPFDALRTYEEALELSLLTRTPKHPETTRVRHNIAGVLSSLDRHNEARALYTQVIGEWTESLGRDHPDTLLARNNELVCIHGQGDLAEARKRADENLELQRALRGDHDKNTVEAAAIRMMILADSGDWKAMNTNAVPVSPEVETRALRRLNASALAWIDEGRFEEACDALTYVLTRMRAVRPADDPQILHAAINLALTIRDAGRVEEAIVLANAEIERARTALGADHAETLAVHVELADLFEAAGQDEQAAALLTGALATARARHGLRSEVTALLAWAVLAISRKLGDIQREVDLVHDELHWLRRAEPESLSERLRAVQAQLLMQWGTGE